MTIMPEPAALRMAMPLPGHGPGGRMPGRLAQAARCASAAAPPMPWLASLLVIAAMLPQAMNISPGGLLLTAPRIVLLAAIPVILSRVLGSNGACKFRFAPTDYVVLAAAMWMFLSVSMTQGVARAMIGSSVMTLELCGGYFLVRTTANQPGQAAALARLLAYIMGLDGMLSVLDVVFERPVMLDIAHAISGYDQPWQQDFRNGHMRALGTQEHPILLGCVCVFGAVMAVTLLTGFRRAAVLIGCLTGLITSNSSGPTAGFIVACGLLCYGRVMHRFQSRWSMIIGATAAIFVAFVAVHPSPFGFLVMHMSSVPQDGFYRLMIWNIVGPLVLASPLFGLGLESGFAQQFGVGNTIDCFWLASASSFGIVGSTLFGLILISACLGPVRPSGAQAGNDVKLGRAVGIVVVLYFLIGLTVHFWGCVWTLMGVFAAMRVNVGQLGSYQCAMQGRPSLAPRPASAVAGGGPAVSIT